MPHGVKVNPQEIMDCARLYLEGATMQELAEVFGHSKPTIYEYLTKHLAKLEPALYEQTRAIARRNQHHSQAANINKRWAKFKNWQAGGTAFHLSPKQIEDARREFALFQVGRTGHFTSAIFTACWCAGPTYLRRLALGFPAEVYVFLEFTERLSELPWEVSE